MAHWLELAYISSGRKFKIPLRPLGNFDISFTPLCQCHSEDTLTSSWSLLSGINAWGSKRVHTRGKMYNLSWTPYSTWSIMST